ncbi:hypothetical protein LO762_16500 [Actinocorallia sp. API 0066]|uniref:phage terminase small subunit n=1 Tax=Actinocorallia sp. API 0066 TaxID=2896846 RepID=UPI001E5C8845|nr:hypothetical protein [Actinocorallia sp. API 0066]MCD0450779.1 hypothetical protein [Actinocorallia sp. API 0066]
MAGMGPPPAVNKRRRNKDAFAEGAVAVQAGPCPPPDELPGWEGYSTPTLAWWNTWCAAPQAALFTATDWQRLVMLAPLVDQYWSKPSTKLMAEIRLSEASLGATHLDRLRARITIERPEPAPEAAPAGVADLRQARRKRMTDAS